MTGAPVRNAVARAAPSMVMTSPKLARSCWAGVRRPRPELLGAIAGRALVVHVAAVERGFLGPLLRSAGTTLSNPIIDTAEGG